MRITRIALSDFKRHRSLELVPAPGLTVIRGPNESGKSTIQQAIELALFRRASSVAAEIAAVRSWDATGDPTIVLDLDLDGGPTRLTKCFAGSKGWARLESGDVAEADPGRIDQAIVDAIGIPSEKFLRSTASVRHFEMEDLDRDERALRDRLGRSIGGGDVGASRARQMLGDAVARLRAAGAKAPGPIRSTQEEIAALSASLRTGEADLEQLSRDRAAWARATEARVALETEIRKAEAALAEAEAAVRLGAQRADEVRRYEQLRRAADLAERIAAAEAAPPTALSTAAIEAGVERLRALELERTDLAAQLASVGVPDAPLDTGVSRPDGAAGTQAPEAGAPAPEADRPPATAMPLVGPWRAIAIALAAIALVALVAGLTVAAIGPLVGTLAAVAAGIVAVALWRRDQRVREARVAAIAADESARQAAERAALAAEAARAEAARLVADAEVRREREAAARAAARRDELAVRLDAVRGEEARILGQLGASDRAAAGSLLDAVRGHAADVAALRAELRGLLGADDSPSVETLRRDRDEAAARVTLGAHALHGLGATGADPEGSRLRAAAALKGARARLAAAIDEEGQAKGRVASNNVDAERVAAIAERLADRQEELALLERRLRIYQQTLDAVVAAEAATMQKAARFLERRMGQDIGRITGGRYDRVQVDEGDLAIMVWSRERGAWVDATQLSKGTADQLYLAARLGLVRQVTQDRRPPLIFDDPFVTFDDDRALRAMAVLRDLAGDHQVLYLTCSARYDAVADAVIELPAPAVLDAPDDGVSRREPPPVPQAPFALTLALDAPSADG